MADTDTVVADAPASPADKTDRAKTFVIDVLDERGLNIDGIKAAVGEAINPLEARLKALEEGSLQRLTSQNEVVPGLLGSPEAKNFNLLRAIRGQMSDRWDGCEIERDVLKAARETKLYEKFMSTTIDASGGFWIPPEVLGEEVKLLRAQSVLGKLGVRHLPGLTKWPVHIPTQESDVTAYWISEGSAPTESAVTVGLIESRPKKVGTYTVATREDLAYADPSLEAFIRESILSAILLDMDHKYFLGAGTSGEPLGLANVTGISTESYVQPATAPTAGIAINGMLQGMINDLAAAYVTNEQRWKWVFNSSVRFALAKVMDADSKPWWVMDPRVKAMEHPLAGFPYQLCNKLDTTSSIADIFLLDPYETMWLEWAGLMIEANPYAQGKNQKVEIYGFQMVDFVARQPKAISLMNDFNVTLTPAA